MFSPASLLPSSNGPAEHVSNFKVDEDVELTVAEVGYLEHMEDINEKGHEQAVLDCMAQFRRLRADDKKEATHQLHRARAVLQHLIDACE